MSIESVMPCNHLILCHPLLLLPSIFPSISVFSNELFLHIRWPKYWSFCFSISPSMNTQDWISLGWIGWISLKSNKLPRVFSKLQFKSINSLVLSFVYSPTLTCIHDYWKNHSFDFVGKVMSLLFNILSRLVITFLQRSKHLLISWLWLPSAVILEYVDAAYCHPAYLTYMQNTSWKRWAGGSTAGIKIAGRNTNNLRYADDTTLMAESEEELKSLLMNRKEESEKVGLKLNIQKIKIVASGPITS